MKIALLTGALAAALLLPTVASAQASPDAAKSADETQARARAALHEALLSKDQKRIAAAEATARTADRDDYIAHHSGPGRSDAGVKQADEAQARARAALHEALLSKDQKRIAAAEATARTADRDDYIAHHPSHRKPT